MYDKIISHYYEEGKLKDILLKHSQRVADYALKCAKAHPEIQLDTNIIFNGAMLHDIGIIHCDAPGIECYGSENYIRHGIIGAAMLRKDANLFNLSINEIESYARICERHTGTGLTRLQIIEQQLPLPHIDLIPETLEEQIICYADKFFSKTHPDKKKSIERVLRSMEKFGKQTIETFLFMHDRFGCDS